MRTLLSALLIGLVLLTAPSAVKAAKPNVVLIVADDLGWADLGCYGSKYHRTPNLDRLAASGMRFTDAYAGAPVCSPTRAALMTGQYPARLHLTDWLPGRPDRPDQKLLRPVIRQELPANLPTLASALKAAGYVTGHIGKWHLGGKGAGPEQRGFDLNIAGDQSGSPLSYFAPFRNKDRSMPGLEKYPEGAYLTDCLTDEAEKFLDANRDKPFFLYMPHYTVHIPLKAKADLIAHYKQGPPGQQGNPIYAAMIESLDQSVGRVLAKLDALKLSDNTLVIFTSDNGGLCVLEGPNTPPTINTPLREGKGYLYEGGLRVPLLVRWPGLAKPGSTSSPPAMSIDLYATILAACGGQASGGRQPPVDGLDLSPLLRGESLRRDRLFWHYPHYSNQGGKPGAAVRAGDLKLIEFYENGRRELYDLKKDPSESHNLAADKPEVVKELAGLLESWRKEVSAQMPRPNPDYVPNPQGKDGNVTLAARTAQVHGVQLRYEPLPHKETLGFWIRADDWCDWEFTLGKPGTFTVEVLQGCGKGQGGSTVELSVEGKTLPFTVEDTGHFQNFKARDIGTVTLDKPGRFTLTVKPTKKAAGAVMDLRSVTLRPKDKE